MSTTPTDHILKIQSYDDARAVCSCGSWEFTKTGAATRKEIEAQWLSHLVQYPIEVTPGEWEVESDPDQFGCYIIQQAAREQRQWVDEGNDLDDDGAEGYHRQEIASLHDRNNRLLIMTACNGCKAAHPHNPVEVARMIHFLPRLYNTLNRISRSVSMQGPAGLTAYIIPESVMEEAQNVITELQKVIKTGKFGDWQTGQSTE